LEREIRQRARDLFIVGGASLVASTAGSAAFLGLASATDVVGDHPTAVSWVAITLAVALAWLLAKALRGQAIVSACAAGVVTGLILLVWFESRP